MTSLHYYREVVPFSPPPATILSSLVKEDECGDSQAALRFLALQRPVATAIFLLFFRGDASLCFMIGRNTGVQTHEGDYTLSFSLRQVISGQIFTILAQSCIFHLVYMQTMSKRLYSFLI
jgi:hypothetical protein